MPGRSHSQGRSQPSNSVSADIDKLDYKPGGRPLLRRPSDDSVGSAHRREESEERSYAGSFFSDVAEGIRERDRERMSREVKRYVSFIWAIITCLGAGSITAYSLYAPLFQRRLHYSQLQVNGVSITAELAMYLPVPLFGWLCDRFGPGLPSVLSGCLFGLGYLLAAFAYKSGPPAGQTPEATGWPYWVMIVAFVGVGGGTSCMYLSAVTTCAKNFGRGRFKGIALALPIACFGLSGMWQSQIGTHLLFERKADGSKGDVDVHRYFLFLGTFLLAVGLVGFFALSVVDEEKLIDEAVQQLEQSGLLEDSALFHRTAIEDTENVVRSYGTNEHGRYLSIDETAEINRNAEEERARRQEEKLKKAWLLNEETRLFVMDSTMWWLAAGFFLVTGPGEAFINNLGTIIGTLYPPPTSALGDEELTRQTSAATHVSIVAVTSTVARILTGTLTDIFAPPSTPHQHRRGPNSLANSLASLTASQRTLSSSRFSISRVTVLITFSLLMSMGQIILATGVLQERGSYFWTVSASIGAGYGAVFSLTPIIVSVVWGVENFGTNWGIVATVPALGATVWGLAYSGVYQWAAMRGRSSIASFGNVSGVLDHGMAKVEGEDVLCYGAMCYAPTFWAMSISVWLACALFFYAWRGPGGWVRRDVVV